MSWRDNAASVFLVLLLIYPNHFDVPFLSSTLHHELFCTIYSFHTFPPGLPIIHGFDIPDFDYGSKNFIHIKEVHDFVNFYGIKLINSSPYYAQANGQAESSNKILVKLIKKKIEDNPTR
jgi:hypothetical protein